MLYTRFYDVSTISQLSNAGWGRPGGPGGLVVEEEERLGNFPMSIESKYYVNY